MNRKVRVQILEDNKYIIKNFYRHHINIYNIEYNSNGNIYTIDEKDVEKLPYEVKIISYKGIKGYILKLREYRHFILALFISICLIFIMGRVVVNIEVIHSDKQIRSLLEDALYDNGIHPFMFKKSFEELQKIKEKIKNENPKKIEWLEIIDEGMRYTVRVEERIITEKEESPNYCDIVSTKDAIILGVVSSEGQNQVYVNDFVRKGSTLISGAITFNESVKNYVCAKGTVYGNTWYTLNISMPFNHTTKKYTEKKSHNIAILTGSKLTEIFKVHFKKYDTIQKKLLSFGNFTLFYETHKEYTESEEKYTLESASKKALELGREKMYTNLDDRATIIDEKVLQTNSYDSIIELEIFYSVKEVISEQIEKKVPEEGVVPSESTQ